MNFEQKVRALPLSRTCWPDQSIHKENYPLFRAVQTNQSFPKKTSIEESNEFLERNLDENLLIFIFKMTGLASKF